MISFRPHPLAADRLRLDPDHLPLRDRACLRVLARADAATAAQLVTLVYGRRRTAQDRLAHLWASGILERSPAPQHGPGTSPYAYRLSRAARARLGVTGRRPSGPTRLRHTLDGTAVVCALVEHGRKSGVDVSAWLPEPMLGALDLGPGVAPDGLIVLDAAGRSGVLCLEVDEGTEHAAVIRPRLAAYARALHGRPGWTLLVVVPSDVRAAWLRRLAARLPRDKQAPIGWVATLDDLEHAGLSAAVAPLGPGEGRTLGAALPDANSRRTATPVGTAVWVQLLGAGGGERLAEVLRP